jgi:hypothetical protein
MTAIPGRSLIVVMAGDNSVHERSFRPTGDVDLWVIYFGNNSEVAERYRQGSTRLFRQRGLKLDLVRSVLLKAHLDGSVDFTGYDYIFLPDDDVELPGGMASLQRLFDIGRQWRLDAFQPAIQNEYYSLGATQLIAGALLHQVNWPEVMMPAFTARAFIHGLLPAVHLNFFSGAGWGLELATARLAEVALGRAFRCAVIDVVPAVHTRPVGRNKNMHRRGLVEGYLSSFGNGFIMRAMRTFARDATPADWPDTAPVTPDPKEVERALRRGYYHMRLSRLARRSIFRHMIDLISGPPPHT